ncbi:hypothetical protein BDY17DRAFT_288313 [Neohortaea acidophila]|uniref:Uncharacterized protein n=1 Tax=Neohortaea acidophila TaxID=245834 RepID=A0A6A6Q4Y2_9PEZI|nr:uncharacterized protein BDY17DRAFT_288313 [Neohortaea acidophila]KAF2487089.1 hypothetical protein BDY17DRAFT_288313 [Neohortaea acidophila]
MLGSTLLRAQLELQSHSTWLRAFCLQRHSYHQALPRTLALDPSQRYGYQQAKRFRIEQSQGRAYAQKASKVPRRLRFDPNRRVEEDELALRAIRKAVEEGGNIGRVIEVYNSMEKKIHLRPNDVRIITQLLHHSLRKAKRFRDEKQRRAQTEGLLVFAESIVQDIMKGDVVPQFSAHVHLLGFFKESGVRDAGVRFWQWLEAQEEGFVNLDVYGAAIELLAVNGSPLEELEDLYEQALERFPGAFLAYHLSPNAALPDREEATTLKGVPMPLLQGIMTARLLRGDARNAYMTFDTALRLYPDQVTPRFFELFLEERPFLEAYTVFAMACRGGTTMTPTQLRNMLAALQFKSDGISPARHGMAVRTMLSLVRMRVGAGGLIDSKVLSRLLIGMTQFLRLRGVAGIDPTIKQQIVDEVMGVIRSAIGIFARHGAKPDIGVFHSMITNLGGHGNDKRLIGVSLSDMQSLNHKFDEVTWRSIIWAAGALRDGELVEEGWRGLVQLKAETGQPLDVNDAYVLITNACAADRIDLARDEYEQVKGNLPPHQHERMLNALEAGSHQDTAEAADAEAILQEIAKIRADLVIVDRSTRAEQGVQDLSQDNLPMTLQPTHQTLPETEMRKLYDELTLEAGYDTQQPSSSPTTEAGADASEDTLQAIPAAPRAAISLTNIPFGQLRYENWKSINYLLEQAENSDRAYLELVDKALAAGFVPPQRRLDLVLEDFETVGSYGLSDLAESSPDTDHTSRVWDNEAIRQGREKVLRLRGQLAEASDGSA